MPPDNTTLEYQPNPSGYQRRTSHETSLEQYLLVADSDDVSNSELGGHLDDRRHVFTHAVGHGRHGALKRSVADFAGLTSRSVPTARRFHLNEGQCAILAFKHAAGISGRTTRSAVVSTSQGTSVIRDLVGGRVPVIITSCVFVVRLLAVLGFDTGPAVGDGNDVIDWVLCHGAAEGNVSVGVWDLRKSGKERRAGCRPFRVPGRGWAVASGSGRASWWRNRDPCPSFLPAAKEETSFA